MRPQLTNVFKFSLQLFVCVCWWSNALAHDGRPVFIQVQQLNDAQSQQLEYQLQWKIPPVITAGQEPTISLRAGSCLERVTSQPTMGLTGKKHYYCQRDPENLSIAIDYPKSNPALSSLIVVAGFKDANQHIFSGPEINLIQITANPSRFKIAKQYVVGGVKHFLFGYDHLLFVICLMVIAASLKRILIAITGFTLAHTLTLLLASMDIIAVPVMFVEVLIALSIVLLAAQIINQGTHNESLLSGYPVLTATAFGLLHGLGFATVLSDLGLPQNMQISALLYFNFGLEVGQLIFIALALVLAAVIKRIFPGKQIQQKLLRSLVYLIGIIASYWLVVRFLSAANKL